MEHPGAGWEQTASLEALSDLIATSARLNHVIARRAGLSETELLALQHLSRDEIGPAEVARRLQVTTAAATGIVDRLVGRGHVERQQHPGDRRRTALVITDSGRREVRDHLVPMFIALDRLDRGLEEGEREVVARYLRSVTTAFERVIEPPESQPAPPR